MSKDLGQRVAAIVRDAGGRVVGRTKLQKMSYVLVAAGLEDNIPFVYKHYGPFSEQLSLAAREAKLLGKLNEREELASWGGTYSIFSVDGVSPDDVPESRVRLAKLAADADAVELELAATALFLCREEGCEEAWHETARRKPEKASNGRIEKARLLYEKLAAVEVPAPLPELH